MKRMKSIARWQGRHSEHQPGEWRWDHMNTTIEWSVVIRAITNITKRAHVHQISILILSRFDWWDGQPDNYEHHEMCLTLWEQHDPFFPIARHHHA